MFVQRASEKLKMTKFMLAYVFDFPTWIIVNVGLINEHIILKSLQGNYSLGCGIIWNYRRVLTNTDPNVNTYY